MFPKETKILIVDDFVTMRKILRKVLVDLGFVNIEEAVDGRQALAILQAANAEHKQFQLIFADWTMPHLSGFELLVSIRNTQPDLPCMIIAAESEKQDVERKMSPLSAHDYLIKPFNEFYLRTRLLSLWSRREPVVADLIRVA